MDHDHGRHEVQGKNWRAIEKIIESNSGAPKLAGGDQREDSRTRRESSRE